MTREEKIEEEKIDVSWRSAGDRHHSAHAVKVLQWLAGCDWETEAEVHL